MIPSISGKEIRDLINQYASLKWFTPRSVAMSELCKFAAKYTNTHEQLSSVNILRLTAVLRLADPVKDPKTYQLFHTLISKFDSNVWSALKYYFLPQKYAADGDLEAVCKYPHLAQALVDGLNLLNAEYAKKYKSWLPAHRLYYEPDIGAPFALRKLIYQFPEKARDIAAQFAGYDVIDKRYKIPFVYEEVAMWLIKDLKLSTAGLDEKHSAGYRAVR